MQGPCAYGTLIVSNQCHPAGVAEYWIVDPLERQITVLTLDGVEYHEAGVHTDGEASSALLAGFKIDTTDVFALLDDT